MKQLIFSILLFSFAACQQTAKHDRAGHSGDASTSAAAADTMNRTTIQQAAVYACPMECEGEKTYTQPGQCPVCKMDLEAVTEAGQ